ncbi:thioredoxin domain-containing protein [Heyndrickxia acidicola]|uniref:Thioredoxin domain-containing protein n=1 Tax=Heyndrickxia acidicola TaxID=209389 RepID=A0ABU6MB85_9BACI|nr:thioredoxin domain-containing protein [Heyndrickxia acidicola]MED1201539.1 thioredoxin domain-containing protein [Heyndrickxia acidicola]
MEKESFEDQEVADVLNEHYISIKVDREERPDVDSIYMNVCQMLTGQGGWPLNVFLTPDQKPFYAGTYFPKESKYGRPGLMDVLPQLSERYQNDLLDIVRIADKITNALNERSMLQPGTDVAEETIHQAYQQIAQSFDTIYGGFGPAPKFPMPHQLMFLLRYFKWTGTELALTMVERTLDSMMNGGIYDQIGGGFSRYSTDMMWLVPHFEKMLYDNALLLYTLSETYQITRDPRLKKTATELVAFIEREMTSPNGSFYSALDADSEGIEGKYYVWDEHDIFAILDNTLAELFCEVYDISPEGNFEGKSIPNKISSRIEKIAAARNEPIQQLEEKLENAKKQLLKEREKRVYPHLDDKVLTSWNGLMMAALAKAGAVFQEKSYILKASKAAAFIESNLWTGTQLYARFRDGEVKYAAYLDDHAYLLWGYLDLYEAAGDACFLEKAIQLKEIMFDRFWDAKEGGFYFTDDTSETLISREKQGYDGALPSGNSVAALQLWKLSKLIGDEDLLRKVENLLSAFQKEMESYPGGMVYMLQAPLSMFGGGKEIFVSGNDPVKREQFLNEFKSFFFPFDSCVEVDPKANIVISAWKDKMNPKEEFALYICENYACQFPLTSLEEGLKTLAP